MVTTTWPCERTHGSSSVRSGSFSARCSPTSARSWSAGAGGGRASPMRWRVGGRAPGHGGHGAPPPGGGGVATGLSRARKGGGGGEGGGGPAVPVVDNRLLRVEGTQPPRPPQYVDAPA